MKKDSFILYADAYDSIRSLPIAQKGQLLDAIFLFQLGEDIPKLDPVVEMAFSFLRRNFDRDAVKYAERCEKARASARKRWDANACERKKRNANDADTVPVPDEEKKKNKQKKFIKPSVEEVKAYCLERGNSINPAAFIDHYEATNWMRGKNKIKDWKACVRTWEQNSQNQAPKIIRPVIN